MFTAQGRFAEGEVGSLLGRKIERNSWDRFDSNAQLGSSHTAAAYLSWERN